MYEIYTDGSSLKNGNKKSKGGYAYAIYHNNQLLSYGSECTIGGTNQQMEILAAICGLKEFETIVNSDFYNCTLYSDSAYLINCKNQKWYEKWMNNGWINSKNEPVANKELWLKIIPYFENSNIIFKKVKGHAGIEKNEFVDKLAQSAARTETIVRGRK